MTKLRRPFLPIAAMALAFALSSCASGDADQFDPTDWVPTNWFGGGKKPLPGERHEVFPGGVPGVPQGVPPDLVMGHQQTPDANGAITTDALAEQHPNAQGNVRGNVQGQAPQHQAAAEAPKQKPKHVASRPKRTTTHTVKKRTPKGERSAESAPATSRAPQPAAQQQSVAPAAAPAASSWPTQPSQPAAQNGAAWPTPSQ
jgi:hypothetical protein